MLPNARLRVERGVIRTFNARKGRISKNQIKALENSFLDFELPDDKWNFEELFGDKEIIYEIGCGAGDSTIGLAKANPHNIIITLEVHRPGVSQLLEKAKQNNITNLKVVFSDGVQVLKDRVPNKSLSQIHAYFPDPWPKMRHHKRRLFREEIISLMIEKIKPGGQILTATDWQEYANEILRKLPNSFVISRPDWRPFTKYEKKGISANRAITEIKAIF
jgi:tRNA (guanine-N7-)-methyltransferase